MTSPRWNSRRQYRKGPCPKERKGASDSLSARTTMLPPGNLECHKICKRCSSKAEPQKERLDDCLSTLQSFNHLSLNTWEGNHFRLPIPRGIFVTDAAGLTAKAALRIVLDRLKVMIHRASGVPARIASHSRIAFLLLKSNASTDSKVERALKST